MILHLGTIVYFLNNLYKQITNLTSGLQMDVVFLRNQVRLSQEEHCLLEFKF